jgi:hypothetical protein
LVNFAENAKPCLAGTSKFISAICAVLRKLQNRARRELQNCLVQFGQFRENAKLCSAGTSKLISAIWSILRKMQNRAWRKLQN